MPKKFDGGGRGARRVEAASGRAVGTVTIGALETVASAVKLAQLLSAFQSDHPDVSLRLKVAGSGDLLRKLEDGGDRCRASVLDKDSLDERLAKRTISAEPLILIAPHRAGDPRRKEAIWQHLPP